MIMTDEPVDDDGHPLGGDDGGGSVPEVAQPAVTKRPGSSRKRRTPNIRYFVAKPSIVAIYATNIHAIVKKRCFCHKKL